MINISFILPCYNVSRYLGDCLDSIFNQKDYLNEIEVICVDDCSTDTVPDILSIYHKSHNTMKIITHSKNKGPGEARNTGIENAIGKYIWFVDPDDAISEDSIESIIKFINNQNADIILFNYGIYNSSLDSFFKNAILVENSKTLNGREFIKKYFNGQFDKLSTVWQCIYRNDFLKDNKITFTNLYLGEDSLFSWKALLLSQHVISYNKVLYKHRLNSNSLTSVTTIKSFPVHSLFDRSFKYAFYLLADKPIFYEHNESVFFNKTMGWSVNFGINEYNLLDSFNKKKFISICSKYASQLFGLFPYVYHNHNLWTYIKILYRCLL